MLKMLNKDNKDVQKIDSLPHKNENTRHNAETKVLLFSKKAQNVDSSISKVDIKTEREKNPISLENYISSTLETSSYSSESESDNDVLISPEHKEETKGHKKSNSISMINEIMEQEILNCQKRLSLLKSNSYDESNSSIIKISTDEPSSENLDNSKALIKTKLIELNQVLESSITHMVLSRSYSDDSATPRLNKVKA